MQKSSVFTCSKGFSFPLLLRSLWVFVDFPVSRISGLLSYAQMVLTNGNTGTSIPWTFFSGVSSHTVPLFSCPCIMWCIVPLQVFVQVYSALNLKLKNTWLVTAYASAGQWRHIKGNVRLVNVWEREGKRGRYLPLSDSAVELAVYLTWLKICQIFCLSLFLLHYVI